MNEKMRHALLIQNRLFIFVFLILLALLAVLTKEYHWSVDITQTNRNTLTKGSQDIVGQLKYPLDITAFASKDNTTQGENYQKGIRDFIARYQRIKPDIFLTFVNPVDQPKLVQSAGIRAEGEIVIEYQKRTEHLRPPYAEQEMTNVLGRLVQSHEQFIMYLDGHGERNLLGIKPYDLGALGQKLQEKGFKLANPDLLTGKNIPIKSSLLVIASPKQVISKVEVAKIKAYLDSGGNLLWLLDDGHFQGLEELAQYFNLRVSQGIVVDPNMKTYGLTVKDVFSITYFKHPITENFMLRTQFNEAHEITAQGTDENGWQVSKLIDVAGAGWLESGDLRNPDKVSFDEKQDAKGPINIALALSRPYGKKGQRVVIVGNANFLSNAALGVGGNLDLGVNMVNWLVGNDNLITIQPKPLKDMSIIIPEAGWKNLWAWVVFLPIFGVPLGLFQTIIPLGLLLFGLTLWFKRRRR